MKKVWDHSSREEFVHYYAEQSVQPRFAERFRSIRNAILGFRSRRGLNNTVLDVLDVGCNAGTHCMVWAEQGHRVYGVDVNEPLLNLARERSVAAGYSVDLQLGSADHLPWPDGSMDVCLAIELLEHVRPWRDCIAEFTRVLRPGGILFLTTTNTLCPIQSEFNLPGYSWYPARVKRYCEGLSVTTWPAVANHARYPAVNWFNPYKLSEDLSKAGFEAHDRFDIAETTGRGILARTSIVLIRRVPPLRWLAHVCKEGTLLLAVKKPRYDRE